MDVQPCAGHPAVASQLGLGKRTLRLDRDPGHGHLLHRDSSGLVMAILLAGLRGVDEEQWKAARIEGIPRWRYYVSIVLPQLGPAFGTATVLLAVSVVKLYDAVVAMTNGGPGDATDVPTKFIMDNLFERQNIGLASAASATMLVTVAIIVAPMLYARSRANAAAGRT
jgi:glucose/mannose transport system permease protein